MLDRGIDPTDAPAVIASLADFDYSIGTDPAGYHVFVGDTEVTDDIREPRITTVVSPVARIPAVRSALTAIFRSLMRSTTREGIVVEGRDITTVVAPDAPVRILLTADEQVRMARRSAELQANPPHWSVSSSALATGQIPVLSTL